MTLNLEDIVGEHTLGLTASATPSGGSAATASASVIFGAGPLSAFKLPSGGDVVSANWANARPLFTADPTP